jgi:transposase InsO family protein
VVRSPWQNPYAERMIGSIRRECLDHLIVLNERQLRRILREYFAYYNEVRLQQSLERNAPVPREVEPPAKGKSFLSRRLTDCIIAIGEWHKGDWLKCRPQ